MTKKVVTRQEKYNQKMKDLDFDRVKYWVHKDDRIELQKFARKLLLKRMKVLSKD